MKSLSELQEMMSKGECDGNFNLPEGTSIMLMPPGLSEEEQRVFTEIHRVVTDQQDVDI